MTIRPAWADHAIWWSVYPLGACAAPIRTVDTPGEHHRLSVLEGWLDHLIDLGCNGLALGPMWASVSHGYDVLDHMVVDPRLGDDNDWARLADAAHAKGIKLMADGVFNHVASTHPRVEQARREGIDSEAASLFRKDASRPDGLSRFEGHEGLVEIDHSSPEAAGYVIDAMNHWLGKGFDAFRLDAAYRLPRPFLAHVLPTVKSTHPDALIMGEILHGDYGQMAEEAALDSVTQYELWKAVWSGLKDGNPHELVWALKRHETFWGRELPWTFVGNHDVTRITSQVGMDAARVAMAIIFTLPGTPAIYYGDEYAWLGIKEERVGGDDAIRPALPDSPKPRDSAEAETMRCHQVCAHIRRTHPWIAGAHVEVEHCEHKTAGWRVFTDSGDWLRLQLSCLESVPHVTISDPSGALIAL